MTEPDFPYKKPPPENPLEREVLSPSPDITKPKSEGNPKGTGTFTCSIRGKSFNTQSELDLRARGA